MTEVPSHNLGQPRADEGGPSEVDHNNQANPGTQPVPSHQTVMEAFPNAGQQTGGAGVHESSEQGKLDIWQLEQRAATSSAARTKLAVLRGKEMFRSRVAEAQEKQFVEQPQQLVATPVRSQHPVHGLPELSGQGAGKCSGEEHSDATHVYEEAVNDLESSSDEGSWMHGSIRSCQFGEMRMKKPWQAPSLMMSPCKVLRRSPVCLQRLEIILFWALRSLVSFWGSLPISVRRLRTDFLSPEMQEAPKPRGRRKTAKKGKKRGCKRTKTTAKADEEPKRKRAKLQSLWKMMSQPPSALGESRKPPPSLSLCPRRPAKQPQKQRLR